MLSKWTPGGAQGKIGRPALSGSTCLILLIITQSHAHVCAKVKTEFHGMNCFTCLLENLDEASLETFVTLSKEVLMHNAFLLCLSATRAWGGQITVGRPWCWPHLPPAPSIFDLMALGWVLQECKTGGYRLAFLGISGSPSPSCLGK